MGKTYGVSVDYVFHGQAKRSYMGFKLMGYLLFVIPEWGEPQRILEMTTPQFRKKD